jgi:NADH dehydrogenase
MKIAVTGAFGYSGRYITQRLLSAGQEVLTLTNSLARPNPFGPRVRAFPFHFDEPDQLKRSLEGVDALVNTYWVRFNHRLFSHEQAVSNTKVLFAAAKRAGVRRIVHVSITNPDLHSDLPYFHGKAELEGALKALGASYCILRPAVLFGKEDVLINNIAWSLRHLPAFGVFGSGTYKVQPIHVDDLAVAAVQAVTAEKDEVIDAVGPETFTYRGLVQQVRDALGLKRLILSVPPELGYWAGRLVGACVRDVVITREEIRGLMQGRLFVNSPPLGTTRLTKWIKQHRETLGRRYTSELARRIDRRSEYPSN